MTAVQITAPIESEILSQPELADICGRKHKAEQIAWLRNNEWKFSTRADGAPIVGRWYARMKLAGVELAEAISPASDLMPDFSKVR